MPNCKLCNKPLDTEGLDMLCDSCQKQKEALTKEPSRTPSSFGKNFLRRFLIPLVIAMIFPSLTFVFNVLLPRKDIPLAEQTVIQAVQAETGKTPFVSSKVAGHHVYTLIAVRCAFREEELKKDTCPTYYVNVSGNSAQIMLVEPLPSTTE